MNKDELYNEMLAICRRHEIYPEMVIKFKSTCIDGKDAQQEADDVKNLITECIDKN